jgi:tetratricopeptide (TPR) repeat protein
MYTVLLFNVLISDHIDTLNNYGVLLDERGDLAAAEAMYQRVLAINPVHLLGRHSLQ